MMFSRQDYQLVISTYVEMILEMLVRLLMLPRDLHVCGDDPYQK